MSRTFVAATLIAAGAMAATPARAVDLPSGDVDRAIVCMVYGGFAPEGDPRTGPAKRAINATVESAVASGVRTRDQVNAQMKDVIYLSMYEEPRSELSAAWNECAASFAP